MLQLFLTDEPASFERYASLKSDAVALFYLALINEGILLSLPTSNHIYLSFLHTASHLERILSAVDRVLERYDFSELAHAAQNSTRRG
jgi:glutamate-1-semialdehyde aminotransferase